MSYVPWQPAFHHTFELCKALRVGTIFPDLCKPFCGRRGKCS
ncbi:MAG: spore coat associated protein CotJA [Eubacteriales bacterium]|nr:spore coat associated protein CotJA [Eubacteriales bacterium]